MARPLIVPLDGSPDAEYALPWALRLAEVSGAAISLVTVHSEPAVYLDGQTMVGSLVPDDAIRTREMEYLENLGNRIATPQLQIKAEVLSGGVVPALLDAAELANAYCVILTPHQRGAIARFFLGSTAMEFIRESKVPVLVVHPKEGEVNLLQKPQVRHILVPLDSSPLAEQVLPYAADLAKTFGASIELLLVLDGVPDAEGLLALHEPGLPGPWDPTVMKAKAERYLEHLAKELRNKGITTNSLVISHGRADEVIESTANSFNDTLIALATHGRGGLAKVVWGSVADKVIRNSAHPTLIFRPA